MITTNCELDVVDCQISLNLVVATGEATSESRACKAVALDVIAFVEPPVNQLTSIVTAHLVRAAILHQDQKLIWKR